MPSTVLERLLRSDRAIIFLALATLTAGSWAYLLWARVQMDVGSPGPSMSGMDMPGMAMPTIALWSVADFCFMFLMWVVMMVGMMTPSVAPMVLIYAGVARRAEERGSPFPQTSWFIGGYLSLWAGFALAATIAQYTLERGALLTPMMSLNSALLGGGVMITVGLYQWTSIKETCLSQCQSPLVFIQHHGGFRSDAAGAFRLGLQHGVYCLGCCWALMALLLVVGVMNLLWIAVLTIIVLLEKVLPFRRLFSRAIGILFFAAGAWMIAAQL